MKWHGPGGAPQFLRFLLVGGINTLFGYGCYCFFIFIGFHYSMAVLLGTCLGVIFNFFTTGHLVFNQAKTALLPRFIAVYCVTYILNILWLKETTARGIDPYTAGAMAILPMALVSFLLNKMLVFRHVTKND